MVEFEYLAALSPMGEKEQKEEKERKSGSRKKVNKTA